MNDTAAPSTPRRRNVVSIELTDQGKALAVLMDQSEEQLVADAVKKHVDEMTAKLKAAVTA